MRAIEIVVAEIAEMALAVGPAVDRLAVAARRRARISARPCSMPAWMALRSASLKARRSNLRPGRSLSGAKLSNTARSRSRQRAFAQRPHRRPRTGRTDRRGLGAGQSATGSGGATVRWRISSRGLEDAPLVAHVGRLEQRARLQDAHAVELVGPVDQDAAEQPHRVGRRAHQLHLATAHRPSRPGPTIMCGGGCAAIQPVADIGEVVGEQVHEGVAVVEVAHRRHGEEQRLEREVEPGRRIERVVVGRRDGARAMVGELGTWRKRLSRWRSGLASLTVACQRVRYIS